MRLIACLMLLALVSVASAEPSRIVTTGQHNITFDLNTAKNYAIEAELSDPSTVNAHIADYYFPTGDWYRGSNQGGANVNIVNTGDVGHLFWVKYSVMDRRGQWYDAPLESVYLNPGEQTNGMISLVWPIPADTALGNCQGRFTVWGGYDENADSVYNLLDEQDSAAAFRIIG